MSSEFPHPSNKVIALVGDTHANARWTLRVLEGLAADGVEVVVQLGDFGWWPETGFAQHVSRIAVHSEISVCFIDGNHENHWDLRVAADSRNHGSSLTEPVGMHPGLWYLPRGSGWEWSGVKFRALGGAFSIDHRWRTAGYDWFPDEESPSEADADRAAKGGPADVLLCHDHPEMGYRLASFRIPESDERASLQVRRRLAAVVEAINPSLVVHGHWHQAYEIERGGVTVRGFDCAETPNAVALLDRSTLKTHDWP